MNSSMPIVIVVIATALGIVAMSLTSISHRRGSDSDAAFDGFAAILAGLAAVSWIAMLLALLRAFSWAGAAVTIVSLLAAARWWPGAKPPRAQPSRPSLHSIARAYVAVAMSALLIGWIAPPWDARLNGSDASVYIGAASHLVAAGALSGPDVETAAMNVQERDAFFANRFPSDSTGPYARFPGGVRLIAPDEPWVAFHFYHLWPVWLAVGLATPAPSGFLGLMPLFGSFALISLFLAAAGLAGRAFGLACVALVFVSFPQLYYMRLPTSELCAQAYFLSGLYCFVRALEAPASGRTRLQLLTAMLWGCLSLTRVEGILFVLPALAGAFVTDRRLRSSIAEWLPLWTGLVLAAALASLHQVAGGTYEHAIPLGPAVRRILDRMTRAIATSEPIFVAGWIVVAGIAMYVSLDASAVRARKVLSVLLGAPVLVAVCGWLALFFRAMDAREILRHLEWLQLYLPGPLLWLAFLGVAIVLACVLRAPEQHRVPQVLLVFLLVPLASLLVNPLVTQTQPWAVRRFVPMVLPLLAVIALLGWHFALGVLRSRWATSNLAFSARAVAMAAAIVTMLGTSAFLFTTRPGDGIDKQIAQLATGIEPDALVLVSDQDANMHLQIAFQYENARSTLLVPFARMDASADAAARHSLMEAYVARQVASGRQVIALVKDGTTAGWLAARFDLQFAFTQPITFAMPAQVPDLVFPRAINKVNTNYVALRLIPASTMSAPRRIGLGRLEEDLPYIVSGFHQPEGDATKTDGTFRWTDQRAEIALPAARMIRIHYHPWRPLQAKPMDLRIAIDAIPVAFVDRQETSGEHVLEIPIPKELKPSHGKFVLSVECDTFSMQRLGLSDDARELGIAILRIDLEP